MKKNTFFILFIGLMLSNLYARNTNHSVFRTDPLSTHPAAVPVLSPIASQAACDGQIISNITITLSGDTDAVLSASSSNDGITPYVTFSGSGASRTMDIATIKGQTGTTTITISAAGTGGTTAQSFLLELGNKTPGTFVVSTLAGDTEGFADGVAAQFSNPLGVAADASGNVYIADTYNNRIRKITPEGVVTTFAGNGTIGSADGTGTAARFDNPAGVAADASGNVYIADTFNNRIRKITPEGVVTTLAGSTRGSADGTGTAAQFNRPIGVAADASRNVYVADQFNHRIRKITPEGVVTTLAGSTAGFADGTGTAAQFWSPYGVAADASGNVYVSDSGNSKIRKITPQGEVTTLAGSTAGLADGTGTAAQFNTPYGVAADASGNVYVADTNNHRIRKITPQGEVTTLAGSTAGSADGRGTAAKFFNPYGLAVDASGNLYVADTNNHRIRKIIPDSPAYSTCKTAPSLSEIASQAACDGQIISNIALTLSGDTDAVLSASSSNGGITPDVTFSGSGAGRTMDIATIKGQTGTTTITISAAGTGGTTAQSFLLELGNKTPGTFVVSTLAGSTDGFAEGTGAAAQFSGPVGLAVDASGNVYVADAGNQRIRKITPQGEVTTLAGSTAGFADGTGAAAQFNNPAGVAADASGNVYVADSDSNRIRKITPQGVVTTIAGSTEGRQGYADGTGTAAQFNTPIGLAVDASGNVYVADADNNRIRKITPQGEVTTLAGSTAGSAEGTGTAAQFNRPTGVAADASGNVYIADTFNNRIRKITPLGEVTTLAGSTAGLADGTGAAAQFYFPAGVAVDVSGNVYAADLGSNRIHKITPQGKATTLAGSTAGSADGTGATAQFSGPAGLAVDAWGNVYVADTNNHRIRKITTKYGSCNTKPVFNPAALSNLVLCSAAADTALIPVLATVSDDGAVIRTTVASSNTDLITAVNNGTASNPIIVLTQKAGQSGTAVITVESTDDKGAASTLTYTVTVKSLQITVNSQTNVTCNGSNDGSAGVSVSGGTPGYSYAWAPSGGTAAVATGLSAGTYTVTVTDANACSASQSFTITEPDALRFEATALPGYDSNVLYTHALQASGGVGIKTFSVTKGSLPPGFILDSNGLLRGTSAQTTDSSFTVTVTDENKCSGSQNYILKLNQIPIRVTAAAQSKVYGQKDPVLNFTAVPNLLTGDTFTGSLTREPGEDAGTYAVNQGTLSAGGKYLITYSGSDFNIIKADQIITWDQSLEAGCDAENPILLTASSSSGLPVNYTSSNSSIAGISDNSLIFKDYGSATVKASQLGNVNYNAAQTVVLPVVNTQRNLIEKHFEDVIFFDNSSKNFKSYTWYKNGILVPGQTSQYFRENGALNGVYYAVGTKLDGTQVTTCALTLSPTVENEYIMIAPNPVRSNADFQLITNISSARLQNARIEIYNAAGNLLITANAGQNPVNLKAPSAAGIYIIKMTLADAKYFTKNLLVK